MKFEDLESEFRPIRLRFGFEQDSSERGDTGSGYASYSSGGVRVRLVVDKGQPSIEVSALDEPRNWYDLSVIMNYYLDESELPSHSIEEQTKFLFENFKRIDAAFSEARTRCEADLNGLLERRLKKWWVR